MDKNIESLEHSERTYVEIIMIILAGFFWFFFYPVNVLCFPLLAIYIIYLFSLQTMNVPGKCYVRNEHVRNTFLLLSICRYICLKYTVPQ